MKNIPLLLLIGVLLPWTCLAEVVPGARLSIDGKIVKDDDISAIAAIDDGRYVLGTDEGRRLQWLEACTETSCEAGDKITLLSDDDGGEIDIEAFAIEHTAVGDGATRATTLYALGSHSCNRKTIKSKKDHDENLERLHTVTCQQNRRRLFRLRLADDGAFGDIQWIDLSPVLAADPVLGSFVGLPSKENGIDLEGLAAVGGGQLLVGFRGPVLRGNWLPVMFTSFDQPSDYELRWLRLGGRGIRSLAAVKGGFLVLAGAVGDAEMGYELFFWDGRDCLPDEGNAVCRVEPLGNLTPSSPDDDFDAREGKAEGMTVLEDHGPQRGWEILVVFDGLEKGAPQYFKVLP